MSEKAKKKKTGYMRTHAILSGLVRGVLRVHVSGIENLPAEGGMIVCSNHISLTDPVAIAAVFPRQLTFLAKAELFKIPVLRSIIRAFGAGLMHGMCTLLVGVGISFVKKKRKLFVVGTFALLSTAITYHGIYNMLVQSDYSIIGYLLPITTYSPPFIWRLKKKKIQSAAAAA